MKVLVMEGQVNLVSKRGVGIDGKEVGSEDAWTVKLGNKGNALFREVPLDAKCKVTIEILETVAE